MKAVSDSTNSSRKHRVLIVGSGFGGVSAAKAFKRSRNVEVTLVSKTGEYLFQPLLYQVATGILGSSQIAPSVRTIFSKQKNSTVVKAEVTKIDLKKSQVEAVYDEEKLSLPFDSLIMATGANQSYFGNDQFASFAPGMKSIENAITIREKLVDAFEKAENSKNKSEIARLLTFVIVGAGPTGIELAGQIAELAKKTLVHSYKNIDTSKVRIVVLEGAPKILAVFPEKLQTAALKRLEKLGVELLLNAMVNDVTEDYISYQSKDGKQHKIAAACKIWSAGVAANSLNGQLAKQTGAEQDRAGRIKVNEDLSLPKYNNVFVVGDSMLVPEVPGLAPAAMQSGKHAAKVIKSSLKNPDSIRPTFKYKNKGSLAIISKFSAIADLNFLKLKGFVPWIMWLGIHLNYIKGLQNKLVIFSSWWGNTLFNKRNNLVVPTHPLSSPTPKKTVKKPTGKA